MDKANLFFDQYIHLKNNNVLGLKELKQDIMKEMDMTNNLDAKDLMDQILYQIDLALEDIEKTSQIPIKILSDHYLEVKKLGKGSFGTVVLAQGKNDNLFYAIKKIKLKNLKQDELDQTIEEANLLKIITTPPSNQCPDSVHAVCYIDIFKDPSKNELYIVMEYIHGDSFNNAVKKIREFITDDKLFYETFLHLVRQTLISLEFIHSLALVHSDIKSDNIRVKINQTSKYNKTDNSLVIGWEFTPIFVDFGLTCKATESCSGVSAGSLLYMSPEASVKKLRSEVSDVWSLGLTLLESLGHDLYDFLNFSSNKTMFNWVNHLKKLMNGDISHKKIETPNSLLNNILEKMLTTDSNQRYNTKQLIKLLDDEKLGNSNYLDFTKLLKTNIVTDPKQEQIEPKSEQLQEDLKKSPKNKAQYYTGDLEGGLLERLRRNLSKNFQ